MISKFPKVFKAEQPGRMSVTKAYVQLKENAVPKFMGARSVPMAMRGEVESELDRMVRQGLYEKVERSEWASPVVIVSKGEGRL